MVTLRDSVELELHESEDLSNRIRKDNDFFEAQILDYIREYYPIQQVIVDVGANIGNHTVYFAEYLVHDAILAFEPAISNYQLLLKNTFKYSKVTSWCIGLGDTSDLLFLFENHNNMGNCRIVEMGYVDAYPITVVSLDSFKLDNVTLLKIDAEKFEPAILRGAQETIQRWHPLILIEDWGNTYSSLLPKGYILEKRWDEDYTSLFKWS